MTKDPKSRLGEAAAEIDLRLGGLLGQLGSALSEALSTLEDQGEVRRETTFDSDRGPVRASAGIRIRTVGGTAHAPEGPAHPGRRRTDPKPPPRPIDATILRDETGWRLIADLPGIPRDDLTLETEAGELVIRAAGRGRRYAGRFPLPDGVAAEDLTVSMQDGLLELRHGGARE
ncbi:Hsp20/alpha crystallin family protein [Rhodobacterales bacterium HKCCE3408]|nr:Hsp20/alpha crystallin family protein [Rhodobacterales bacterium HKCCE3408]